MTEEQKIQADKEAAVKLALQHGMALIRRGLEIYGLRADGTETKISESADHDSMWLDALTALREKKPLSEGVISQNQYLRLAADFENYKRGTDIQMAELAKFAGQSVIMQMVDVMDLLEQAIAHAPPDAPPEWLNGLRQVGKQAVATMGRFGVKRIDTDGKAFDPMTMEAVSMTDGGESQTVKQEVRAGYMMHDRVIRPARVIIYQ